MISAQIQYRLSQDPVIVRGQLFKLSLTIVAKSGLISNVAIMIEKGVTFEIAVESI